MYKQYLVETKLIMDKEAKPLFVVKSEKEVYDFVKDLQDKDKEIFLGIYLDSRNRVIGTNVISIGTLNSSLVHPREVYKIGILLGAAALILVHNHPSGLPDPSDADLTITKQLKDAGELLGIELLDHVIIGYETYKSIIDMI